MGRARKVIEDIQSAWYQEPILRPSVEQERESSSFGLIKRNLRGELRTMYRNGRTGKIFLQEIKDNNAKVPGPIIDNALLELENEGQIKLGTLSDVEAEGDVIRASLTDLQGQRKDYLYYIDSVQSSPYISSGLGDDEY
jgi:hypothetical protein